MDLFSIYQNGKRYSIIIALLAMLCYWVALINYEYIPMKYHFQHWKSRPKITLQRDTRTFVIVIRVVKIKRIYYMTTVWIIE